MDYNNNDNQRRDSDTNYTYSDFYKNNTHEQYETPKRENIFLKGIKAVFLFIVFVCVVVVAFLGASNALKNVRNITSSNEVVGEVNESETDVNDDSEVLSEKETDNDSVTANGGVFDVNTVTDVSEVVDEAMPSIVAITNIGTYTYHNFFGMSQTYESESAGSGIILGQDEEHLYIATNNHVVNNAETLTVTFIDESQVSAEVKGADSSLDLAVISVDLDSISDDTKKVIKKAAFAKAGDVKQGEFVIAIGNALGYGQSVTTGIVSALDREVTVSDDTTGTTVTNSLIQTDAAINPGNSGGALLNIRGEVIGINSVKTSETSVEGMGYAIPASTAVNILNELMTREIVQSGSEGYLGVSGVDVSEEVAKTYNMPQGVYISRIVSGSAAEIAGLKQGDIITGFAGRNVTAMEEIQDLLQYYAAGTTVDVVVERSVNGNYEEMTFSVTLGNK